MLIPYLKLCNYISIQKYKLIYSVGQKWYPGTVKYCRTGAHCCLSMHNQRCFNSSADTKNIEIKSDPLNQDYLSLINTRVQTCLATGEWNTPDTEVESALAMEYNYRQKLALTAEYEYEKERIYERMHTWTPERLQEEGYALFGLSAHLEGELFQDKIVRFTLSQHTELPYHRFGTGDHVKISHYKANPKHKNKTHSLLKAINGVVLSRQSYYIDICIHADIYKNSTWTGKFRLDSQVNEVAYERMFTALDSFVQPLLYSSTNNTNTGNTNMVFKHSLEREKHKEVVSIPLRNLILYTYPHSFLHTSAANTEQPHIPFSSIQRSKASSSNASAETVEQNPSCGSSSSISTEVAGGDSTQRVDRPLQEKVLYSNEALSLALKELNTRLIACDRNELNPSQLHALKTAVQSVQPLVLIQGPPGTGKTTTATALLTVLTILQHNNNTSTSTTSTKHNHIQKDKQKRILVCTQSHTAADNLLLGLSELDIKVLRLGIPAKIKSELRDYSLNAQIQVHPDNIILNNKEEKIKEKYYQNKLSNKNNNNQMKKKELFLKDMEKIKKERKNLERKCISQADIVVVTCIGAGSEVLKKTIEQYNIYYDTVLVDEATQCTELAIILTILYNCKKLILIGDQNQLAPVILNPIASLKYNLNLSLFSRFINIGIAACLLNEQYRMHPKIAQFSSEHFYNNQITSNTLYMLKQPLLRGFHWPNPEFPIVFIDISPWSKYSVVNKMRNSSGSSDSSCSSDSSSGSSIGTTTSSAAEAGNGSKKGSGAEDARVEVAVCPDNFFHGLPIGKGYEQLGDDSYSIDASSSSSSSSSSSTQTRHSYYNSREAAVVERIVTSVLEAGELSVRDIGIISPYNAQVKYITDLLHNNSTYSAEDEEDDDSTYSMENDHIEISSVDGFQGREKELIIFTAVRSNKDGEVGFLSDWRRLNVAITRSKRGLIIIGDANTLSNNHYWKEFIIYCKKNNSFRII